VRFLGFGEAEAEALAKAPKAFKAVVLLCADADLDDSPLKFASQAAAILMQWVRAACALAAAVGETLRAEVQAAKEKNGAAAKLQGLQRQRDAKKRVEQKRKEVAELTEQFNAAAKLQGLQRQRDATKRVEQKRKEVAEEREQNGAAAKLQSKQRQRGATKVVAAMRQEKEEKEQNGAAAKLQSKQRQRNATKVVAAKRQEKLESEGRIKLEYDMEGATPSEEKQIFALSRAADEAANDSDGYGEEYEYDELPPTVADPSTVAAQCEPTTAETDEAATDEAAVSSPAVAARLPLALPERAAVDAADEEDYYGDEYGDEEFGSPVKSPEQGGAFTFEQSPDETGDEKLARLVSTAGSEGYGDDGFDDDGN
jgi:hypothetical protein